MADLNDAGLTMKGMDAEQEWASARGYDLCAPHWDDLAPSLQDAIRRVVRNVRAQTAAALPPAGERGGPVAWQLVEPEPVGPTSCIYPHRPTVEGLGSPRSYIRPLYASPLPAPQPPSARTQVCEACGKAFVNNSLFKQVNCRECNEKLPKQVGAPVTPCEPNKRNPNWSVDAELNKALPAPPPPSAEAVAWLRNEATDGAHLCDKWSPRDVPKYAADLLRFVEGK